MGVSIECWRLSQLPMRLYISIYQLGEGLEEREQRILPKQHLVQMYIFDLLMKEIII